MDYDTYLETKERYKTQKITLTLPHCTIQSLKAYRSKNGVPVSQYLTELIESDLKKRNKKIA